MVMKPLKEIVADLETHFPEGAPSDHEVRSQGFVFHRKHWLDRWPASLPTPPVLHAPEPTGRISRSDVLARAKDVTSNEEAIELYVLMCSWVAATKAQRIARCVRPLHQQSAPDTLMRSHIASKEHSPVEAYRRLNTYGEDKIKHFGPAFFTKWVYFSANDNVERPRDLVPLILDARVAAALGWKRSSGWSSRTYGEYLELAQDIRTAWSPDAPSHAVEYGLFRASAPA